MMGIGEIIYTSCKAGLCQSSSAREDIKQRDLGTF